jgi:hypothetical protein
MERELIPFYERPLNHMRKRECFVLGFRREKKVESRPLSKYLAF